MGQQLSRVYNVEHRAAKEISRIEDPAGPALRAPMFHSDKELLENIRKSNPTLADSTHRKDSQLHSMLQDVYVKSEDQHLNDPPQQSQQRPLPLDRVRYQDNFIPGMMRVDKTRKTARGKVTLDEAVEFLTNHTSKPEEHTATSIADTYRLNATSTANVLKYFKMFKIYVPEKKITKPYDPLEAGKDWVEGIQESRASLLDYEEERKKRVAMLKEKEALRKNQPLLEGKSRPDRGTS
ncbi:protein NDUFAF4 homolog isoform X2 [Eurytemora carolleeae]|uniref:protein NDUFAF4 homolog isoform X2 n=1 Tax=Eurytemora carolleeae TaxID=1294199 RepID=UPI000C77FBCC|nr:protein NDUFAF4 homolog isoform X2 [Eurytemora carolleeae]|eukprot:XP_023322688.1 protein NDUFAF4 homolog isoform X2 [Eurytemora affinis]